MERDNIKQIKLQNNLSHFLCDTWWYGLTNRINNRTFESMVKIRKEQKFDAIQTVIGVPPEIGLYNENAKYGFGAAWDKNGNINNDYIKSSQNRVKILNNYGFTTILYGAWGYQIEWLGLEKMKKWWKEIVSNFNEFNVYYCLAGESNLSIGREKELLPNKTSDNLVTSRIKNIMPSKLSSLTRHLKNTLLSRQADKLKIDRIKKWSEVVNYVSQITDKPLFIHTLPKETSEEVVTNPNLLSAVTVQTGHDALSRNDLWKLPLKSRQLYPKKPFINLEPWYEGILNNFDQNDQLYAAWVSLMSGSHSLCYGAHGLWNLGDGTFLSHWGKQTLTEALELRTPFLIGKSFDLFRKHNFFDLEQVEVETYQEELIKITRYSGNSFICYIPEIRNATEIPKGNIFVPTQGEYIKKRPRYGSVVIHN